VRPILEPCWGIAIVNPLSEFVEKRAEATSEAQDDVYCSRPRPHILDARRELNWFFNKLLGSRNAIWMPPIHRHCLDGAYGNGLGGGVVRTIDIHCVAH